MSTLGAYLKGRGWIVHDTPISSRPGVFEVRAIMIHHTAGNESINASQPQAQYLKSTLGDVPAPTANLFLDSSGAVWVISARQASSQSELGRANHAGAGIWPTSGAVLPKDQGNNYAIGIEIQNDGTHPITGRLYTAAVKLCADLCERYTLPASRVIGHKEYAQIQGKIDPLNVMSTWRADVAALLAKGSADVITPEDIEKIADAVWGRIMQTGWQSDGTYDRTQPVRQKASWFLISDYANGARALNVVDSGAKAANVIDLAPETAPNPLPEPT